jgi:predicted aspartyl protease
MFVQIGDRRALATVLVTDCDEPLLGVETLEALGLAVDPSTGTLRPTRKYTVRLGGMR